MFEMTVSTIKARNSDMSFIIDKLRPTIKALRGIMVCEEFDGRIKLALAVCEEKKDYFISIVFDVISEAIIRGYKEEYLKKHLKLGNLNKLASTTFIKILTMFDKAEDKLIIKKQLHKCDELYLDSLYNFRLWELEKRWKDICDLVKENSSYLMANDSFFELMKFLLATAEVETSLVRLLVEDNFLVAKLNNNKELFRLKVAKTENFKINVLSEIISCCPEKIVVESSVDEQLLHLLTSLFENRVSIDIKNC